MMQVAARSARGRREYNDDVVLVTDRCVVLADGMGGHAGGRQAAQVAVGAAAGRLASVTEAALFDAFSAANQAVRSYQLENPDHADAGCTLTVVGVRSVPVVGFQAMVAHAGDSPAFLLRGGDMTLLTPPHTVAQHLRDTGRITEEQARTHSGRNTLQRSVGNPGDLIPDVREVAVQAGDRLLVCSDGLLEVEDRRRLRDVACDDAPAAAVIDRLVELALETSNDNITVALMEIGGASEVQVARG